MKNEVGVIYKSINGKWELVWGDGTFLEIIADEKLVILIDNEWRAIKGSDLKDRHNGLAARIP